MLYNTAKVLPVKFSAHSGFINIGKNEKMCWSYNYETEPSS